MALTDPGGAGGGRAKVIAKSITPPLPSRPTPVDMAALDQQYANVASLPRFEDETVAYDARAGAPRVTPFDDVPRPQATPTRGGYPSVPPPLAPAQGGGFANTMAVLQGILARNALGRTPLSTPPPGYRSLSIEDRRTPTLPRIGADRPDPASMNDIIARARGVR